MWIELLCVVQLAEHGKPLIVFSCVVNLSAEINSQNGNERRDSAVVELQKSCWPNFVKVATSDNGASGVVTLC